MGVDINGNPTEHRNIYQPTDDPVFYYQPPVDENGNHPAASVIIKFFTSGLDEFEAEEGMILHEIRSGWETTGTYLEYRWDEELQKEVLRVPEDFEERKYSR